jgi:hypothetical protein
MINQKIVFLLFYFFLKDVSCFMLMNEKKSWTVSCYVLTIHSTYSTVLYYCMKQLVEYFLHSYLLRQADHPGWWRSLWCCRPLFYSPRKGT